MKKLFLAVAALLALPAAAAPGSVAGSKHDFSVTGPGPIRAAAERNTCVFCHASHAGGTGKLSARPEPGGTTRAYESSTLQGRAGAPGAESRSCLSCHDGTVAVGQTRGGGVRMSTAAGDRLAPGARGNVGTDLRRTHPLSVRALASSAGVRQPGPTDAVKLDDRGELQCTTCHDPHAESAGTGRGRFLRASLRSSELCLACHAQSGAGSHARSPRPFGPLEGNADGFASVGDAGCSACHRAHSEDGRGRLLDRRETDPEDGLCLRCHSGSVARLDVARDLSKRVSHAVPGGRHDAAEGPANLRARLPEASAATPRHAACVDCHEPHQATDVAASGSLPGALAGSWGIDLAGQRVAPARFEYEVCLKCHGDSLNRPQARGPRPGDPVRRISETNLRRVFDPSAPSSHPVAAAGRGAEVPSLRSPWTVASRVACGDCHASDTGPGAGGAGPRGPHGSAFDHLLERQYLTADQTPETAAAYALCYKCHDRDKLLSAASTFASHRKHVVDQRTPCSACHAAHGVAATAGTSINNAHLVDFDTTIVQPSPLGQREYVSRGARTGSCSLTCHGAAHDARSY